MSYKQHTVEIADEHNGCSLMCTCGEEFSGHSWEDVGKKFDEHANEVAIHEDGE